MIIETLHDNEWLSLKVIKAPEKGINGYVYSHETRCQGCIIAVLPYRVVSGKREYMIKCEITPCWSLIPVQSALTGGWEGKRTVEDAQRELHEESGYEVPISKFISLGESYASKSSDTRYALFSVDLTGVEPGKAEGDGSVLEAAATSPWVSEEDLVKVEDPQVHVMLNRLKALRR